MSKPKRSTAPDVMALAARMPDDHVWAIVAYTGGSKGRWLIASTAAKVSELSREMANDMPETWDDCELVAWSERLDPGEIGF